MYMDWIMLKCVMWVHGESEQLSLSKVDKDHNGFDTNNLHDHIHIVNFGLSLKSRR